MAADRRRAAAPTKKTSGGDVGFLADRQSPVLSKLQRLAHPQYNDAKRRKKGLGKNGGVGRLSERHAVGGTRGYIPEKVEGK